MNFTAFLCFAKGTLQRPETLHSLALRCGRSEALKQIDRRRNTHLFSFTSGKTWLLFFSIITFFVFHGDENQEIAFLSSSAFAYPKSNSTPSSFFPGYYGSLTSLSRPQTDSTAFSAPIKLLTLGKVIFYHYVSL